MAFTVLPDEELYAARNGIKVYSSPDPASPLLDYSIHYTNDHRPYKQFDGIGHFKSEVVGTDGKPWLAFAWFYFDDGGFFGQWHTLFRDAFLPKDGGDYIPESQLDTIKKETERTLFEQQLTATKYPAWDLEGVPRPTSIEWKKDTTGVDKLYLTWANGYTSDFDTFDALLASSRVTYTTKKKAPTTGVGTDVRGSLTDGTTTGTTDGNITPGGQPKSYSLYAIVAGISFFVLMGVYILATKARKISKP